ncbi:alanyl (membrane) aminopeptidase-like b [Polymixia lowei]
MAKGFYISKALAVITVILTTSAIAGIITMVIVYQTQIDRLNPTPRPTFPPTTPFPTGPPPNIRLPENLVPESYKIYIQPHLYTHIVDVDDVNVTSPNQTMVFTGNSTVNFHCVEATKTIFLHSKNLTLGEAKVTDINLDKEIRLINMIIYEDGTDFLEIQLDDVLEEGGNYSLFLDFKGEMTDDLAGLYVSKYNEGVSVNGSSTERFLAVSQMQPTDARKALPCFDEPAMKATFEVTIIHRRHTTALGNWEQKDINVVLDDEWMYTSFYPTAKMSTYLLAFAVSEFQYVESAHDRIYARREAIEAGHADYAANITGKILKFYEDYFDIKYPLKTLDQIAVPEAGAGAMENWGLVTYVERALLYDEGVSSLFDKELIANIIAHELVHQWFGNLVTMKWWNDLWLNEGFASYLSSFAVDHIEPDWNVKDMSAVMELKSAFEEDSLDSSPPLSPKQDKVQSRGAISAMFNGMTYSKGASVLRMLEDFLTHRVFLTGLKMYLKAFQFKNTENKDLWYYLNKAVKEDGGSIDVSKVMDTWTNQNGYPVVTINTTSGEAYQTKFLFNHTSVSDLVWHIPIRVMSLTSKPSLVTLDAKEKVMEQFISMEGEWVLANINHTGYFRVNYNPENWERLLVQLETNPDVIPAISRGQLIDDAFNLARAKLVNVTLALNLTRFLYNETAFFPWNSASTNLEYFHLMFDRSEVHGPMQAYLRKQVRGLYNFLKNYTDNLSVPCDHSQQHNQLVAINMACDSGLPECQAMVTRAFRNLMKNDTNNAIPPNLRHAIYCQALTVGGEEEWDFAWKMFQSSTLDTEKSMLLFALSCTRKIWLLNRYLEYSLDPDKIRKMDTLSVVASVAANVAGEALAWNFVRAHWTLLSEDSYGGSVVGMIGQVFQRFSTEFELQELIQLKMEHADEVDVGLDQAIERTQANVKWVKENKQTVLEWFKREAAL